MRIDIAIVFCLVGSFLFGLALRAIFARLKPSIFAESFDKVKCRGGWWEEKLNNCQDGLKKLPQQPVNTYTNIAYAAGGIFALFTLNSQPSYIFFLASLHLCAMSALYHGAPTRWTGMLDVSGMYALFSSLAAYAACMLIGCRDPSFIAFMMLGIGALSGYLLRTWYDKNVHFKVGVFILLTYGFSIWSMCLSEVPPAWTKLILSFVLFLIAFGVWHLDKAEKFPIKRWGHGLWHILTAVAICILFFAIDELR